ncbi:hypothetical protein [Sphingomonas sp. CFBP 8760]|uniref:hypothetical protein n=1 Tax=Sphingomonas sp. CFBP 8760 TaxID=2775282 RepID=UPI00177AD24F|nr:hypothetical protein [Sphingomonas sp. CFBP 8760]MBD8547739.1 hypothetical protein [Sphingomonas sp. CFBP 8760]
MPDDRVADRVSADMERIFRRHPQAADTPAAARAASGRSREFVVQTPPADRTSSWVVRLVTIVVPLIAIAVLAFLFLQIGADRSPAAALAQASPVRRSAAVPPVRPAPATYRTAAPVVVADEADEADMPAEAIERAGDDRLATSAVPARRSRVITRTLPVATARSAAADDGCRPGSEENRCIYREVRAADRRLVAAYHAATEAGVPRREMLAVRRIWTRALAVSLDDPDGTIRTYDELAARLRDAARQAQADDDRP